MDFKSEKESIFDEIFLSSTKYLHFLEFVYILEFFLKKKEAKVNFSDDNGRNILWRCHILVQLPFPKTETEYELVGLSYTICGALPDLVPFVQFKKCEKHPWRSVNFSNVAG